MGVNQEYGHLSMNTVNPNKITENKTSEWVDFKRGLIFGHRTAFLTLDLLLRLKLAQFCNFYNHTCSGWLKYSCKNGFHF